MAAIDDQVLNVADLVGRPGASRRIGLALTVPEDLELPLATIAEPLRLQGVVESVVDGLLVRGTLTVDLGLECARCLEPVEATVTTDVAELFVDPARVDDNVEIEAGYVIDEDRLDLDTLLRDAIVPAVPGRPLCDEACKGLCPTCGTNRNDADCDCADTRTDARWAALENLHLDR